MSRWILGNLVLGGVCSGLGVGRGTEGHLLTAMQVTPLREEWLTSWLCGDAGEQAWTTKPDLHHGEGFSPLRD